ncbi:Subunit of trna-specific adenosine-34 deaminase, partial [Globisporangium splendens]
MESLEEIVAHDALPQDADAQQRFYALAFPAQHGSAVMKHLGAHFRSLADMGYAHLKRMKKHPELKSALLALITPVDDNEPLNELLATKRSEMEEQFQAQLTSVSVLKHAPQTREAFEQHTKAWPLIFHASVLPVAQAEPISESEAQQMTQHVRAAVTLAAQFDAAIADMKLPFCCAHGCIVVDPLASSTTEGQVVADSFARRDHASYAFCALYHPVVIAVDSVAERDRQRAAAATTSKKHKRTHTDDDNDAQMADSNSKEDAKEESYLCTGYDVYMDREPCVMCAMALVHSRARRIVFATLNATDGALASVHRLHTIKSLNHHYRVFHLRIS